MIPISTFVRPNKPKNKSCLLSANYFLLFEIEIIHEAPLMIQFHSKILSLLIYNVIGEEDREEVVKQSSAYKYELQNVNERPLSLWSANRMCWPATLAASDWLPHKYPLPGVSYNILHSGAPLQDKRSPP